MTQTTARLDQITDAISQALRPALGATSDHKDAMEASKAAGEAKNGARLTMMLACAQASLAGSWTDKEITQACKLLVSRANDPAAKKTLGTLASEVKNAAHPLTRAHAQTIVDVVNNLWDDADADKEGPHPLKACFARRYHAYTGLFKQAAAGSLYATEASVLAYARANDPAHDAERVLKKLQGIVAQLTELHHDFQDEDIGMCIDTLNKLTSADLERARVKSGAVKDNSPETEPATTTTLPTVVDQHANQHANQSAVEPMTGAVDMEDMLDSLLGDKLALQAA